MKLISSDRLVGEFGQIRCPMCRQESIKPEGGFPVCPLSVYLSDLIEKSQQTKLPTPGENKKPLCEHQANFTLTIDTILSEKCLHNTNKIW